MSQALSAAAFETFASLLKSRSGLVIGADKLYLLETRLASILKREQLRDLATLAERLRIPSNEALIRQVVEAMTTNESFFFRDDKPFQHFRSQALSRLVTSRSAGVPLRIWSAASSSGQEAYSLAMIVTESRAILGDRRVEIIGTDLAHDQVVRARDGLYTQFEVQRGLPVQMLMRYFRKEETGWRINEALRGMVQFREWNLLGDLRPLGQFDVVFCRNVLIYFDQPTKARVLDAVAQQMPSDGMLYLGGAETVLGISSRFAPLPAERGVYGLVPSPAEVRGFASEQSPFDGESHKGLERFRTRDTILH
jgi:chemotaxis protein methyltransferase CheR